MTFLTKQHRVTPTGFTLIETVLSIGIFSTFIVIFLAIFGFATGSLDDSIDSQEADRLVSTLGRELSIIRADEVDSEVGITTAFDKAYHWIQMSSLGEDGMLFVYSYEGNPNQVRPDGSLEPVLAGVGGDTVATAAVHFVKGGNLPDEMLDELDSLSSPVFLVRLNQLVYEGGELTNGEPGITPPREGQTPLPGATNAADAYPEAVIAFTAEFYQLASGSPEFLANLDLKKLKRPLFSRPMTVRR